MKEFCVRPGLWDDTTKIGKVGKYRHTVIFPEDERETEITFCNNCGSPFTMKMVCQDCGEGQSEGH